MLCIFILLFQDAAISVNDNTEDLILVSTISDPGSGVAPETSSGPDLTTSMKKLQATNPTVTRQKRKCQPKVAKNITKAVTTRVTKRNLLMSAKEKSIEYMCIYCDDKFVDPPPEPWSQCSICLNWCHEACVLHMKPPFPANFACVNCMPKRRRR